MRRTELHTGWTVRAVGGPVPHEVAGRTIDAQVPGVVHDDLLRAGLIEDPLQGMNEEPLTWVGHASWEYRLDFTWLANDASRHDLVFDGLDTVATVTLNGTVLGAVENQHRTYRFDVRDVLRVGANVLKVSFTSVHDLLAERVQTLGRRPQIYPHPFEMVRKSACNFGWDWGPEVVTAGIWRAVRVESWSGVRIAALRPAASADGLLRLAVELEHEEQPTAEVTCRIAGQVAVAAVGGAGIIELQVPEAELWWPRGYGEQPLYDLEVRAGDQQERVRVGFRTIEIERTPDSHGVPFVITVNGVPVSARGANWIPDDVFATRMTPERYRCRLADATDANMNLVRVWGGGIYEADSFYDACDELGLLVWQDFLFACAAYPEEEPLWSQVEAEATDAINRLAAHPSLVIWNGSNENLWGLTEWGWDAVIGDSTWGQRYYEELLPSLTMRLDPSRPYIPSSPFSWASTDQNDPSDALTHRWDVWNELDYRHYTDIAPRFVSEFGLQGAPGWHTLTTSIGTDNLNPATEPMASRQKAADGIAKMDQAFAEHLPEPATIKDWFWTTQLNQATGLRVALEHFRATPGCTGMIVWQLNDCWPVLSWSLVDSTGWRKPAWFTVRDAYADALPVLTEDSLLLVNDSATLVGGTWRLQRFDLDGTLIFNSQVELLAEPGQTARHRLPADLCRDELADGIVSAACGELSTHRLDREVKDSGLRRPELAVEVHRAAGLARVQVTTGVPLVDLCLLTDRLGIHAQVDSAMVTLLPGQQHTFTVHGDVDGVDDDVFTRALHSANSLLYPDLPAGAGTGQRLRAEN